MWESVLLTINSQRQALCKEGFGLFCLSPLAWVDGVLRHQFEEVKEELVKGAASLKILSVMGAQLKINQKSSQYVTILIKMTLLRHQSQSTLMQSNYKSNQ